MDKKFNANLIIGYNFTNLTWNGQDMVKIDMNLTMEFLGQIDGGQLGIIS